MYSDTQKRIIAHEIARAGGNVAAALRSLRTQYETFDGIGDSTLRRLMKQPGFTELVAEKAKVIYEEQEKAIRVSEAERLRRDLEGSLFGELRADDSLLNQARKRLEDALNDPAKVKTSEAIWAFEALAKIIDRRREKSLPVLSSTREATILIRAMAEEAQAMFGHEKSCEYTKRVKERYLREINMPEPATEAAAS